ncbi:hypothetical protein EVAR_51601_1 [Eumeta japonica]|uniref:Uncharacterized protein n=1 Tax=Eumeta variegata TaxID=151549 RepID=A0A4C1YCE7_EUMVA|nr:hypothetical protein EVAR_51601_1 [Eumeta japonica]
MRYVYRRAPAQLGHWSTLVGNACDSSRSRVPTLEPLTKPRVEGVLMWMDGLKYAIHGKRDGQAKGTVDRIDLVFSLIGGNG